MNQYKEGLKLKMHNYAKLIYKISKNFPRDELYGLTSQLRRSGLSVILNYIEGYARFKQGVKIQFYETAFGSLKESKYLVYFCFTENLITEKDYKIIIGLAEEIGKMLWSDIKLLK